MFSSNLEAICSSFRCVVFNFTSSYTKNKDAKPEVGDLVLIWESRYHIAFGRLHISQDGVALHVPSRVFDMYRSSLLGEIRSALNNRRGRKI